MDTNEWSFESNIERGCLPTGEPLEALYGTGPWTRQPEPEPNWCQCPFCGATAIDMGDYVDCEMCGVVTIEEQDTLKEAQSE